MLLQRHHHADDIFELQLSRPPVNALNPELLTTLREAIDIAPREGARALVISGSPGIFSAGLDVPTLLTLERPALEQAWRRFFDVCAALAHSPIPTVAALTGHAPAGGAVLGLYCDYRIMADGDYRIGLNEVQVGLVVPECIQQALCRLVGAYRAERLMVAGAMIDPAEAQRVGLIDERVDGERVVARSVEWLQALLALPPQAMLSTRRIARRDLRASIDDPAGLRLDDFLDAWFGEETQGVLRALVARLKAKG